MLIDARTGVTELGGLATTVLADTVVCMFVANDESLDGTLAVVEALKSTPRLANQKSIRVVPVLSRSTVSLIPDARFTSRMLMLLGDGSRFFVLPHDDSIGTSERLIGVGPNLDSPLYEAYIELLRGLFPGASPTPSA